MFALAAAVFTAGAVQAQNARGTSEATIDGKKVSVEYGRPGAKGRDMLGMAPVGTVWRTGADTSTTFTSAGNVMAGGKTIPAGSYSLFTKRVDDKTWHLIFNKQTGQWGTEHDASQDLAEVPLQWVSTGSDTDPFTMEVAEASGKGMLKMMWGKNVLTLPFEVK